MMDEHIKKLIDDVPSMLSNWLEKHNFEEPEKILVTKNILETLREGYKLNRVVPGSPETFRGIRVEELKDSKEIAEIKLVERGKGIHFYKTLIVYNIIHDSMRNAVTVCNSDEAMDQYDVLRTSVSSGWDNGDVILLIDGTVRELSYNKMKELCRAEAKKICQGRE